jgi:hypothetical protein
MFLARRAQAMNRTCMLALLLYLTLDLCNPFMPGAFDFSADESTEVTQLKRDGTMMAMTSIAAVPVAGVPHRQTLRPQWAREIVRVGIANLWLAGLRHDIVSKEDSPPSSEDDH